MYDCVYVSEGKRGERETEKRRHGCHSNCVIMLVAIMKAMKTGKGRGLAQKRRREKNSLTLKRERKLSIRVRSTSGGFRDTWKSK